MPIFQSGAFIQQCHAVHPLSLSFKVFLFPDQIGVLCTNCNLRHRLTVKRVQAKVGEASMTEASQSLQRCVSRHPEALRLNGVNVEQDWIRFHCRECKKMYHMDVSLFETHQPSL